MAQSHGENLKQAMDTLRDRNHRELLVGDDAKYL